MTISLNKEVLNILQEQDAIVMRKRIQERAGKIKMGLVNQTKLQTAASELVRNMLYYAGGGRVMIEMIAQGVKAGLRLTFMDEGPGIENIAAAMEEGYSTSKCQGQGLPGARKLCDQFDLKSEPGKGTCITIIKMA